MPDSAEYEQIAAVSAHGVAPAAPEDVSAALSGLAFAQPDWRAVQRWDTEDGTATPGPRSGADTGGSHT
ncbi:protein of unknown function [Nocardia cyriacigeorgica GUH-2]|uniref:Uncharacterized protein n=1 Tax=Nocardia cyriacigeorgica (strain GUH-2) TaxID=1127134 RepID=H6R1E9_NOCCG|nr:protein of unknown function [Nocardia cyriacigeorgica GUH-2]